MKKILWSLFFKLSGRVFGGQIINVVIGPVRVSWAGPHASRGWDVELWAFRQPWIEFGWDRWVGRFFHFHRV